MENDFVIVTLQQRHQNQRRWLVNQAPILAVGGYADYGVGLPRHVHALAHGILARPIAIDERLVDDGHRLRGGVVLRGKIAPCNQRRA
jgi:hypothetical protein